MTGELGQQTIALGLDRIDEIGLVDSGKDPVDEADQVALAAVAKEVVERESELVEIAFAQGKGRDRTIGKVDRVPASGGGLSVAAVSIGLEAAELGTVAAMVGEHALDRLPARSCRGVRCSPQAIRSEIPWKLKPVISQS